MVDRLQADHAIEGLSSSISPSGKLTTPNPLADPAINADSEKKLKFISDDFAAIARMYNCSPSAEIDFDGQTQSM
ncbi:hypothetical protein J2W42_004104 [Rhizobium tibeticum]|uniref:hypothetical protein n=1 Tax=Rhizobium TaxID=379 RepID=UPI00068955D6|nr:hypothetical protein [Rhizobium tibeticum]MDP9811241.1 hypothetical protein [Rhizobium tibeticum]